MRLILLSSKSNYSQLAITNNQDDYKMIWLIPFISTVLIILFISFAAWHLIKKKFLNNFKPKDWENLNEETLNYGACSNKKNNDGHQNDSFLLESKLDTSASAITSKEKTNRSNLTDSTSLSSIVSQDNLTRTSLKKSLLMINYSICFKNSNSTLLVNLISLENVKTASKLSQLNVYVKIEVSFNRSNKTNELIDKQSAKTRLIRNRSNPVFDELFEFNTNTSHDDIDEIKIIFNVCNSNLFGRDHLIGVKEHIIDKKELMNIENNDPFLFRMFSNSIELPNDNFNLGQVQICLCYKKLTKTLSIHLIKGVNLQIPLNYPNNTKLPNSFIKVYLLYKGQRVDKKQTKVHSGNRNPVYDELVEFNLVSLLNEFNNGILDEHSDELVNQVLSKLQIFFLVMDYDQLEKSDAIGKIELMNQIHQQRLISLQKSVDQEEFLLNQLNCQNWYNIFYMPDMPILGLFQLKNF